MERQRMTQGIVLGLLVLSGAGCALFQKRPALAPEWPPVIRPTTQSERVVSEGSLWTGDDSWSLFVDDKASREGDLVLVKVVEDSEAEKEVETKIKRDSDVDAGIQNLLGFEQYYGDGPNAVGTNKNVDLEHLVRSSSQSKFDQTGNTKQTGRVVANVMAQVIERRRDGNLRIYGSQVVTINNEDQVVTVSGLIRPSDIKADNSIPSNLVADARILYSGRGPTSTSSRPGLLMKAYYALWPF